MTDTDLNGLTMDDLWRARNEIFARHGLIFSTPKGKAFANILSRAGVYSPVTKDQDALYRRFNEVEKANVDKIKRLEGK